MGEHTVSEKSNADKQSPHFPGIAIGAILLGLLVFQDTIFNPTRPSMSDANETTTENVRSRLWQDPFEAVTLHQEKYHNNDIHNEVNPEIFVSEENNYAYQLVDGLPRRICNDGKTPKAGAHSIEAKAGAHSIEELRCQVRKHKKDISSDHSNDLHILAVMVPGGPYAEEKERRLRSRYAVISGLAAAGYVPEDPEHIGFVNFSHACIQNLTHKDAQKKTKFCEFPTYMPYEWFKGDIDQEKPYKEKPNKVLILWLNNNEFTNYDNPVKMLGMLNHELILKYSSGDQVSEDKSTTLTSGENEFRIHFNVIGPEDSGLLKKMYMELIEKEISSQLNGKYYQYLENSLIFSPSATMSNENLIEIPKATNSKESISIEDSKWYTESFIRTITTQDKLAGAILCELALRNVIPFAGRHLNEEFIKEDCKSSESEIIKKNQSLNKKPHNIVLIGELDTLYSRDLTDSIKEKIGRYPYPYPQEPEKKIPLETINWVHTYNFLRGLDGINAAKDSETKTSSKNNESKASGSANNKVKNQLRRPTGPNQLDYLRRLADQIERLHLDLIKDKQSGIKAIGILGNDFYDKLLILQALHKKFPEMIFFTFDLDARFLHPDEKKWTRNLIVASPFGLSLSKHLQKSTPPFRDSYQTSLYLTTMVALECWKGQKGNCIEQTIGKSDKGIKIEKLIEQIESSPRLFEIGNYDAVDLSHTHVKDLHPIPEVFSERSEDLIHIWHLSVSLFFMMLLLPYLIPTDFRKVAVVVCFSFILLMICYIFLLKLLPILLDGFVAETFSLTNGTSTWPANAIRILAIFLTFFFLYDLWMLLKKNNAEISDKYAKTWENKYPIKNNFNCLTLLNIDLWEKGTKNKSRAFKDYWFDYLLFSRARYRVVRITLIFIIFYLSISFLLESGYLEGPSTPFRGKSNSLTNELILYVAAGFQLLIILLIADIAHVSSHFIKLLRDNNVIWPKDVVEDYHNQYGLFEDATKSKILSDFAYQHADAINKFIYYPFIILFLMILSQSYYFDNWHFSPLLLTIIGITALIALASAIRLRKVVQDTRNHILEELNKDYWRSLGNELHHQKQENSAKLQLLINEIRNLKEGPFLPLSQHPIMLSFLLPFGGVSGVYLLEYFALAP